jgi:hypothetical protein
MLVARSFLKETRGSVRLSRKAKVLDRYDDALEEPGYHNVAFSRHDAKLFAESDGMSRVTKNAKLPSDATASVGALF